LRDLRRYFTALKQGGITLNLSKSEFAKPFVRFVGFIVGSGTVKPDNAKVEAILRLPRPTSQQQLKSFLGMMSYHRSFIPRFADIAKPLTDLTSVKFVKDMPWSDVHDSAFLALKCALSSVTSFYVPRICALFILRVDASGFAISGCLYQRDDDVVGNVVVTGDGEHPISFFSRKLNATQMAWSVIEREAYAVIESLKHFDHIVFGSQIVVYSDHNPLSYLTESIPQSAKLVRWSLALQQYCIIFRYAKAANNVVADYFSRYSSEALDGRSS
jgi:hypothetical protein